MSGIITAVFKATVGWLVDKGRDEAAKRLKDGDVTDQQFRGVIMREIDDTRSKLDGLSRKDLLASISFFRVGVELLYEVFEDTRSRSKYGADTAQAACAEAVSLTEGMKHLELTKSATRKLADAKKRFESAREKATDAFCNEALSPNDRILSMQYRVMATVLEKIDHPEDVLAPCKVCIEELNSLLVVQQSLREQLKTGFRAVKSLFNKEERRKVISGVCLANRVAFNVIRTVLVKELFPEWLMIDTGEEKVDLLRDPRVREILCKQGMENCSVPWILDHDGEEEHGLKELSDIATNSSRQYILAYFDLTIKVFDNSGKFVQGFRLPPLIDDSGKQLSIKTSVVRLATDMNDNIYVLVREESRMGSYWIFKFNKTADQHHKFRVERIIFDFNLCELSVSDSGKVLVLKGDRSKEYGIVDVYETNGQLVCSFGQQIVSYPSDITTVSDGRVMVVERWGLRVVHIFSEQGDHLNKFCLQGFLFSPKIVFHRESQQVAVVDTEIFLDKLYIEIYSKDGEFVRSISIHMGKPFSFPQEVAVTTEGCIAVLTRYPNKVIVI